MDRFWAKVDKSGECWVWTGTLDRYGYGRFYGDASTTLAHRVSWERVNGPIPLGLSCCHHCDNPPCVRPDHLFIGTHLDNMRDRDLKGRARPPVGRTRADFCNRGHPLTNAYCNRGNLQCQACRAISRKAQAVRNGGWLYRYTPIAERTSTDARER